MQDSNGVKDAVSTVLERARPLDDRSGIWGKVVVELWDEHGDLKAREVTHNLCTQTGDQGFGDRAAQILGSTIPVTAITNAAAAVCTTTGTHNFSVGDRVVLAGVTPSGYNNSWAITAVTAGTFTINVGTALGVLTVAGTAQGLSVAAPVGMKLGTGGTAVAKTGAGAALVTYLSNSHQVFDGTFPNSAISSGRAVTFKVTYAAGKATTASAITEVVIYSDVTADATSTAANTWARALLAGIPAKAAGDTLTITWVITLLGS